MEETGWHVYSFSSETRETANARPNETPNSVAPTVTGDRRHTTAVTQPFQVLLAGLIGGLLAWTLAESFALSQSLRSPLIAVYAVVLLGFAFIGLAYVIGRFFGLGPRDPDPDDENDPA